VKRTRRRRGRPAGRASPPPTGRAPAAPAPPAPPGGRLAVPAPVAVVAPIAVAVALSVAFVAVALRVLATLPYDFDEAWLILDARFILRGQRPFVDFAHHEMPLHLYLLAAAGEVFGPTLLGYRMLSLLSIAGSGLLLFWLARSFVGPVPALFAQAAFLFTPLQSRALTAVPETPAVLFSLLGAFLLFARKGRWSARASGVAFVVALLIKPTCIVMVGAAALALVWARDWRRLLDFAVSGVVASLVGLVWANQVSDGVFGEILRFQLERIGTRKVGMWSIDSGFVEMRRLAGVETPWQWAVATFQSYYQVRTETVPIAVFVGGLLAVPIWVLGCARARPAMQLFAVLWPASYLLLNFVLLDFVSPRYFVPFLAFSAFLFAGWVWLVQRWAPAFAVAGIGVVACVPLVVHLVQVLGSDRDPWYWGRSDWITQNHPKVASFTPMLFAATGAEPGCDFANPALTYGGFGETFLVTERTRQFRFSDERLIECLRANPTMPFVVDWAFYFFTRPGSPLRAYLDGEGKAQLLFFSPDAMERWKEPSIRMSPYR
jgi:hypothetical protein